MEWLEPRNLLAGTPLANDADTLLMLRFDNSLVGAAGETPTASSGVTYETGQVNQAARTGSPGYVRYATSGNLAAAQGTIEFWIKPTWNGNTGVTHAFFEAGDNFNNGMLLSIDGANNLRCIQWGDDPSTGPAEASVERGVGASGSSWVAGAWYHLAAAWNGNTGHLQFFVNGQSVGEITNGVRLASFSTTYFNVGSETNNQTPAAAAFDEFRISNRERTAAEILDDYAQGLGILSTPAGMTVDCFDRSLVAEATGNRVKVFSSTGTQLLSFGSLGAGNGQFNAPRDVATDAAGNIFVADAGNNRIQKFNYAGAYLGQFSNSGTAPGQLSGPKGICIAPGSGKIYVADTGNQRVQRFNANGTFDATWGTGGVVGTTGTVKRDHTGFDSPTDVALNPTTGEVYVSDYGNQRIEVFSTAGVYLRTYLAVYRANQLAFDAAGNLYIAGEDPNESYTAYDGRLRLLRAGQSLITAHYTGGALDDVGRIETGVAVRADGTVLFADALNGRLAATDANFTLPASGLSIDAKGTQVTFRWKTKLPVASAVRYGATASLGSQQSDSTPKTDHVVTVSGLTPNTCIYYSVGFLDTFDGHLRFSPPDPINTGAASGRQFLRLKVAGVIYTDANTGAGYARRSDVAQARTIYSHVAEFYWRNSQFSLWPDVTIVEIDKDITTGYDLFGNMQADLAAVGYSATDDFDAAWGSSVMCPGNYGGGGSLFGRFVGMCEFVTQDDWSLAHEGSHTLDSIYYSLGLRKYEFNHGIWAVPGGVGRDWAVNAQVLRNMLPANFTAVSSPFTKVMSAPDADADGVPDSSPAGLTNPLAITEATAGTSTALRDSDGDGVADLAELTALPYHGTNPLVTDTDGDGTADAADLNPAYPMNDHVARATPTLDGSIGTEGWTVLTSNWGYSNNGPSGNNTSDNDLYQSLTTTYAAWDDNYLYLAYKGPAANTNVRVDGGADNWFMSPDNYDLNLNSGASSYSVRVNVGVPDVYRQIDNDGQYSEFFDTDPQFTRPYQGRTIYNNPSDGLGFASRLVTESDLTYRRGGSGNNSVWEVAIPWSNVTGLRGQVGKTLALWYRVAGDLLFETDHFARVVLGDGGPNDIVLAGQSVAENQPAGTVVGSLSTSDPDAGDTFTYSLVSGTGGTDNAWFRIEGNQLKTAAVLDFEVKSSCSIRVRSTDPGGLWHEKVFAISVRSAATGYGSVFALYTDPSRATSGLVGSYVNQSLRAVDQLDWRASQTISGTRVDPALFFCTSSLGSRAAVGVTGGTDADWDQFSVQWDGVVEVLADGTKLATRSDDGSRLWIDLDRDGTFETQERFNNSWGTGHGATIGEISPALAKGFYPVRVQFEEGNGGNTFSLVANPVPAVTSPTLRVTYVVPSDRTLQAGAVANLQDYIPRLQQWYGEQMDRWGLGWRSFTYETMADGTTPQITVAYVGVTDDYLRQDIWGNTINAAAAASVRTWTTGEVWLVFSEAHLENADGSISGGTALGASWGSGSDPGIAMLGGDSLFRLSLPRLVDNRTYAGQVVPEIGPYPLVQSTSFPWFEGSTFSSIASSIQGAAAHELGHGFGQPHDFRNDANFRGPVMGNGLRGMRGASYPNLYPSDDMWLSYGNALALSVSRYFRPGFTATENTGPTLTVTTSGAVNPVNGLLQVAFQAADASGLAAALLTRGGDLVAELPLSGANVSTMFTVPYFNAGQSDDYTVIVYDQQGNRSNQSVTITVNTGLNRAPQPYIRLSDSQPTVGQSVTLDASSTSDPDHSASLLTVEWDLNGDGVFDTSPTTTKTYTTQFATAGTRTVTARITDPSGAQSVATPLALRVVPSVVSVLSIDRSGPSPTNAASVDFTVTFNAAVTGVNAADFALATTVGGTIASVTGSGTTYIVTITGIAGDGTLGLNLVDDDTIADTSGNKLGGTGLGNGNFPGQTYAIDQTPPTVAISGPSASLAARGPVTFTVTYADANFAASTLSPAGVTLNRTGTASGTVSVSGSGTTRTVTINNISGDGSLGISLSPGTASDTAGNLAPGAGPSGTFAVDNTRPTISIGNPSAAGTKAGPVAFIVTYADANLNAITLDPDDVSLNTTGTAAGTVSVTGSGLTRTVTISNITGDGSLGISIAADTASDLAGNLARTAGPSNTFVVDNTGPSVLSITRIGPSPTNADSVQFSVTFNEEVLGVDPVAFSVALTGGVTCATPVAVAGSGANYTVTVNGIDGNGTLGLVVVDNGAMADPYGNHFDAGGAPPPSQTYAIDNAFPTVLSINRSGLSPTNATSLKFTVTFSESVTGVDVGDFLAVLTSLPGAVASVTGVGASYTVTVNLTGSGTARAGLNLADNNSIVDAAGNVLGGPGAGDGNFTGQVYNVDTSLKFFMYWLKPVTGGTGDYSIHGSFVGGGQNTGDAYTVSILSLPSGQASINFQLYASIGGQDANPGNDSLISGLLDILNTPAAGGALLGQPNPVALVSGLNGVNSSGGQANSDIDGAGGVDLGGPLSVSVLPGTDDVWVRPYNPSVGVAGTAVNSNGWTDILLGTFTYTYGTAGGVLGGQATQLSTAAVSYTGGGSGKFAEFWRQDGSSQRESDGTKIGAGPAVTIAVKPLVSIGGVSQPEGDGTTDFVFPVTLSMPCAQPVQVTVDTADGTATVAGNDYQGLHQVLTFAPGETSKMATVHVLGNTLLENDETFSISLSNVTGAGASLAVGAATATIHNDDGTVLLGNGGASVAIACNPGDPTHGTADLFLGGSLTPTYSVATTRFSQFHIVGGAGLDQVTLDFGQGNPLPAQGLVFDEAPGKTGDILAWQNMTGPVLVSPAGITDSSLRPVVAHNVSFREFAFANAPNNRLTIDGTALTIGRDNAISANAAVEIVHGGLLDLGNKTDVVQSLVLTDGRVINGELQSASHTLAQGEVSANLTGGRLVKSGPGTAIISGQNGYTGGTEVESDVLLVASVGALPRGGDVTIGPGATLALQRDLNLAAAARTIAASAAQVSRAGTSGPPAPSVGRGSSAPVQTDMMCQPSPPAIAPLPTTICEFRTEPTALQALAPAAVKAVAEPAARADLQPASLRVRAARLAVKDAAIALRQAAQLMPDASWLALIEHAIRLQRSSEKTGQAQALVDEVLARYGL